MTSQGLSVSVVNASKAFTTLAERIVAVDEVSLSVDPGEFVCISGASGSGKSTLLNLVAGIATPDSGSVSLDGEEISALSEQSRAHLRLTTIGVVFQHDNLIEEFTVGENVAFPLELRRLDRDVIEEEVDRLLALVGLTQVAGRRPEQLSGGQQQRVGVARALAGDRRLLVADEPSAALDRANSAGLFALFRDLSARGVTVVLASHDPLARSFADRVVEMVDGAIVDV